MEMVCAVLGQGRWGALTRMMKDAVLADPSPGRAAMTEMSVFIARC